MSTLIRSALVAIALVGSVSAASATGYWSYYDHGYRHDHGHHYGYWTKSYDGRWHHHNTLKFFDQLRRNGN